MVGWECRLRAAQLVSDQCNVWEELFALQSHFCCGTEHQSPGQAEQDQGSGCWLQSWAQEQLPRSGLTPAWGTIGAAAHANPALGIDSLIL